MSIPFLAACALALLTGVAGLWLLPRPGRAAVAGGLLLLLATASVYVGLRLRHDATPPPFRLSAPAGHFQAITPAQLPEALAASRGRLVLLEFQADWCPSCLVWKQQVFSRPEVRSALTPLVLLQVDATAMTPEVQALLDRFGIAGLPALLVFDRQGREQPALRLLGEMTAADFLTWLRTRLGSAV